jgi:hypothetical protein
MPSTTAPAPAAQRDPSIRDLHKGRGAPSFLSLNQATGTAAPRVLFSTQDKETCIAYWYTGVPFNPPVRVRVQGQLLQSMTTCVVPSPATAATHGPWPWYIYLHNPLFFCGEEDMIELNRSQHPVLDWVDYIRCTSERTSKYLVRHFEHLCTFY